MGRWIRACVVLHNLLHDWKDGEDDWLDGVQADDTDDPAVDWQLRGNETNRAAGSLIRDALRLENAQMMNLSVV